VTHTARRAGRAGRASSDLTGLHVLVTGAGGDIGRAVCDRLHLLGARPIASDLPDRLEGLPYPTVGLDVTDADAVREALGRIQVLDGLILAHGITSRGRITVTPMAATRKVIEVNLVGAAFCAQAALPALVRSRGRIAVVSSVAGFGPLVDRSAYSASKHGLFGFFDTLRAETATLGVSVTVVAPSFVRTGIEDRAVFQHGRWVTTGQVLTPEQAARAIVAGMARRRRLVLPSRTSTLGWWVSRASPRVFERLMLRQVAVEGASAMMSDGSTSAVRPDRTAGVSDRGLQA